MIVKINGVTLASKAVELPFVVEPHTISRGLAFGIPLAAITPNSSIQTVASVSDDSTINSFLPLLHMLQDWALPVGIGVAMWGLYEYFFDNGMGRVKKAIWTYILFFVIPVIFFRIHDAFAKVPLH